MTIVYPHRLTPTPRPPVAISVDAGGMIDVRPPKDGMRIDVRQGRVWITQTGDPTDHVLTPGETFETSRDGMLVVQALVPSSISVPDGA